MADRGCYNNFILKDVTCSGLAGRSWAGMPGVVSLLWAAGAGDGTLGLAGTVLGLAGLDAAGTAAVEAGTVVVGAGRIVVVVVVVEAV